MDKKRKQKIILSIIAGILAAMTMFSLIFIMLYYNVFHSEHTGAMEPSHIVLLVCSIIGLLISLFLFDKIKKGKRIIDNRTASERLQSLAEYHLQKRCRTAEKLHASLSDTLRERGIVRVRPGFLSYDLLYYIKPGKWFGFTFHEDYRDNYIEAQLGALYHFGDVIPRLLIVGEYSENIKKLNSEGIINSKIPLLENANNNIKDTVEIIKNTFEAVIVNIEIEVEYTEKKRLTPYLIKEFSTFNELKIVDKNAIVEELP